MSSRTSPVISPSYPGSGAAAALGAALLLAWAAPAFADSGLPFDTLVAVCASCHGQDGRASVVPDWGRLAGQNRDYLVYALRLYRNGGRSGLNAGLMLPYATALSDSEIRRLAEHYAGLP
ncbi:MAG: c-type cytochrome [Burkholderiales bacterium]